MPLESASFINGLDPANPAAGDTMAQADDHIRLIKAVIKATFPNITGAVTITQADLNGILARLTQLEAGNYIGKVTWNAGATTPSRHLLCHGQAVSRTTYALLFTAIGTTWGAGNGTTTFNVPDLRGRILAGLDNMGGTNANRMSVLGATATTLGGYGGSQNLGQHAHTITDPGHTHTGTTNLGGAHTHPLNDPGHAHTIPGSNFAYANASALFVYPVGTTSGNYVGVGAIAMNSATTGITVASDGNHTHNFTTASGTTGITVTNTGTGTAENIPPVALGNYVIFAGV